MDPFEPGGLGGAVQLPALPDAFTHWIATHDHVDHNASSAIPGALRLRASAHTSAQAPGVSVDAYSAFHDEFGGRLRGGSTDLLRFRCDTALGQRTVMHCGDLGERPVGRLLDWLRETPIDVLIVPVGGYFTLGGEGAAELVSLVRPSVVVPCHAREHGVALPQLQSESHFLDHAHAAGWDVGAPQQALNVASEPAAGHDQATRVVRFTLPR